MVQSSQSLHERIYARTIGYSRELRSKYLGKLVEPLNKIGITGDHLTILSFICGLIAVWFLFRNNFYFVLFGILHIFLDAFDGVLARTEKPTKHGAYMDTISDNLLVVIIFVKSFFVLDVNLIASEHLVFVLVAALYAVQLLLYLYSRLKAPALFTRTLIFILYFFGLYYFGVLLVGMIVFVGLWMQVLYFLK